MYRSSDQNDTVQSGPIRSGSVRRQDALTDLAALLPTRAVADLAGDRHQALRRLVMDKTRPEPAAKRVRRFLGLTRLGLAPAASAVGVTVAIVIAGVAFSGTDRPGNGPGASATSSANSSASPTASGSPTALAIDPRAVNVLGQIATAAQATPELHIRNDQFFYVDNVESGFGLVYGNSLDGPPPETGLSIYERTRRQTWSSPDGSRLGYLRVDATSRQPGVDEYNEVRSTGDWDDPHYRWLATWPTDTAKLRSHIYARPRGVYGAGPDDWAFSQISAMLTGSLPVPPKLLAALYRVAATIPGVEVSERVDARQRPVMVVSRAVSGSFFRIEWVFDKSTLALRYQREVLTKDMYQHRAGAEIGYYEVTKVAVVDNAKQLPPGHKG